MALDVARRRFKGTGLQQQYVGQFIVLWLIGMLAYMGFGLVSPQFSILITGQGIGLQQFGLIQGVATFLSISFQVSIGKLSDRIDRRKPVLTGALLLLIPVTIIFPHSRSLMLFMILLAINQLGSGLFNATAANWVTRFGVSEQMGRLHGYYRISFSVGWVLATWLMGKSLDTLGVVNTFYLGGAFIALALLLAIIATNDIKNETSQIEELTSQPDAGFVWTPELKMTLLALGIFTLAQSMGSHLNYIFFKDVMHVTNRQFGSLASVQSWLEIPLMLGLGIASDRISNTALVAGGMLLAGVRWLGMYFVQGMTLLFLIQPLHAVGMTVTDVIIIAVLSRQVPRRYLGTVMGWQVTAVSIARLVAPVLAGAVGELWGIRVVFLLSSLICAVAGLLFLHSIRRTQ